MALINYKESEKLEQFQSLYSTFSFKKLRDLQIAIESKKATRGEIEEFSTLVSFERIRTFENFIKSMNYPIDYQWFHWLLVEVIDEMIISPHSKRLMIEIPPRHCKTLIAGIFLCTYLFGRFKDKSIIYATANNDKAVNEASNMRNVITSDRYQQLFPGAKVKSSLENIDVLSKRDRKNKKDTATVLSNVYSDRGSIRCAGMGDMLSGHPGHFLVADDLYKGYAEAQSDKIRETIWQWFWTVFMSRADKSSFGAAAHGIVFFTRWHDDDICGRIQRLQTGNRQEIKELEERGVPWIDWDVFSFEAIKTDTKISHPLDKRKVGEPLWKLYEPEYYSHKLMNPLMFEAIYQGNPINMLGKLFERSHFQEYEQIPKDISRIIITVDPNLKEGKISLKTGAKAGSDNFAICVHGTIGNRVYLLDWVAKSKDYQVLKMETMAIARKYPYYWALVIEQTASGPALTSDLKQYLGRIVEFAPGSPSKYEKASLAAPTMVEGKYFVPSRNLRPDIDMVINQFIAFTGEKGKHDDIVDAVVIALLYYMQNKCLSNVEFIKTESYSSAGNLFGTRQMTIKNLLPNYNRGNQKRLW
jgi:predicted phage terminase large subunit-like protein